MKIISAVIELLVVYRRTDVTIYNRGNAIQEI
jgi:hypothetical protein